MSLETLIVIVLLAGFAGFIAYKFKKNKDNKTVNNNFGGSNIKQEYKPTEHKK